MDDPDFGCGYSLLLKHVNLYKKNTCFTRYFLIPEYIEFWFDTIHCHQAVKSGEKNLLDPPIFIVFTGADKYEKVMIM